MKRFILLAGALLALGPSGPRWNLEIDSRNSAQPQWVAESANSAFAIRNGRVTAIDLASGNVKWQFAAQTDGTPAYIPGAVAIPVTHGLAFIDPSTGTLRKEIDFRKTPIVAGSNSNIVALVPGQGTIAGYAPDGREVWHHTYHQTARSEALLHLRDDAVAVEGLDTLIVDARNGNVAADADDVVDVIGFDGRYLWFSVSEGGIKGVDLTTNKSTALHDSIVRYAARVEHGIAVAVLGGRLKVIDLADNSVTPLHIDGRWVGGPIAGKIFVERDDGLYIQSIRSDKAKRVATYSSEVRLMASDRGFAIAALRDGTIYVIDATADRVVQQFQSGCSFYEGFAAIDSSMLVHCDQAHVSHLMAFPRPI